MGILAATGSAALALLAGCYSPSLRDCTVACAGPGDCAPDQVCGPDGMCASPEMAGRCAMETDAGGMPMPMPMPEPSDAGLPDAPAPDATPLVRLRVQVDGKGSVILENRGTCSSMDPSHGNCMYDIPVGVAQHVQAMAIGPDDEFTGWTSFVCAGQGPMCSFTPLAATAVTAKFSHIK
ncbi:MAG TPA: hypothetical protein VLM79_02905 [Kofleriaceae bacterium]|nr:hypothetical protein [Kofleriaceae bacterium]